MDQLLVPLGHAHHKLRSPALFLNIERVSLPDIDVDFCERRRTEVIKHMRDTYGANSVAQITTFGTMKPVVLSSM